MRTEKKNNSPEKRGQGRSREATGQGNGNGIVVVVVTDQSVSWQHSAIKRGLRGDYFRTPCIIWLTLCFIQLQYFMIILAFLTRNSSSFDILNLKLMITSLLFHSYLELSTIFLHTSNLYATWSTLHSNLFLFTAPRFAHIRMTSVYLSFPSDSQMM